MAVNVTEASAINVVLQALYRTGKAPSDQELRGAALLLCDSARKRLGAGVRAEEIMAAPRRPLEQNTT